MDRVEAALFSSPPKQPKRPAAAAAAVAVREQVTRESPTKKPRVLHDSAKRVAIASQYVYAHRQCDSKDATMAASGCTPCKTGKNRTVGAACYGLRQWQGGQL